MSISLDIPGGDFTAALEADGSWTIRDVPFFAELAAGARGNSSRLGKEWMGDVIKRHEQLAQEGHLAPVHINHHGANKPTRRVGFLLPKRVGKLRQRGRQVYALFGDLLKIHQEDFDAIKGAAWPYRSAEISSSFAPQIASLALMADQAPFFTLPMLTVGQEIHTTALDAEFGVAVASCADASHVLFHFTGDEKMSEQTKDGAETRSFSETELSAALEVALKPFSDRLDAIESKLKYEEGDEPSVVENKGPVDENFSALESRVASQAAELAFFREEFKKQEEERHLQSLVELHLTKLRDDGWCVTESTNAALQEIAQNSTDPESSVKAFCDSYRRSAVQDPPETFAEVTGHNVAEVPEFVQAYQKEGPEVYENAVAFSSQYDELKAAGADVRESREEFVANLIRGI